MSLSKWAQALIANIIVYWINGETRLQQTLIPFIDKKNTMYYYYAKRMRSYDFNHSWPLFQAFEYKYIYKYQKWIKTLLTFNQIENTASIDIIHKNYFKIQLLLVTSLRWNTKCLRKSQRKTLHSTSYHKKLTSKKSTKKHCIKMCWKQLLW